MACTRCQDSLTSLATAAKVICWARASTSASNSSVKPESLPNQSGSSRTTRPSGSLTRGGSDLEVAFMLEEVEVAQPLGLGVMDPMQPVDSRCGKPAAGDK